MGRLCHKRLGELAELETFAGVVIDLGGPRAQLASLDKAQATIDAVQGADGHTARVIASQVRGWLGRLIRLEDTPPRCPVLKVTPDSERWMNMFRPRYTGFVGLTGWDPVWPGAVLDQPVRAELAFAAILGAQSQMAKVGSK